MSENFKKTSPIWEHYTVVDAVIAKCAICKSSLSYKSSITNLKKHIQNKHPSVQIEPKVPNSKIKNNDTSALLTESSSRISEAIPTSSSEALIISSEVTNNNELSNVRQSVKRKSTAMQQSKLNFSAKKMSLSTRLQIDIELMKMFTNDFQPFSIVEDRGFIGFVKALNPSYQLPNRQKITKSMLPALFQKTFQEIKDITKSVIKCSLTTDCWTSCNNESFLGITFHYIDDNFNIHSLVLGCVSYNESHTSVNLARKIKETTDEFDLNNKICLAVSDNAPNITSAITKVLEREHFGCLAHTINLIVQKSLKGLVSLLDKVRKIVVHFKKSSSANNKFLSYQLNNCNVTQPKKLFLDVTTRWNSTFYMLERFYELQDVVKTTLALVDKDLPILTPVEWQMVNQITKILKPFESITKIVSGEKYISASLVIILVNGLKNNMNKIRIQIDEPSEIIEKLISSLRDEINKRFELLEENNTLCISTFLDPRFKTVGFLNNETSERVKEFVIRTITTKLNIETQIEVTQAPPKLIDETSIWSLYDEATSKIKPNGTEISRVVLEVNRYLDDDLLERSQDPLSWWQQNRHNYPHLSQLAKEVLCAMATSVPCERMFSKAGNILTDRRTRLKSNKVEQIIFLNQNLKK